MGIALRVPSFHCDTDTADFYREWEPTEGIHSGQPWSINALTLSFPGCSPHSLFCVWLRLAVLSCLCVSVVKQSLRTCSCVVLNYVRGKFSEQLWFTGGWAIVWFPVKATQSEKFKCHCVCFKTCPGNFSSSKVLSFWFHAVGLVQVYEQCICWTVVVEIDYFIYFFPLIFTSFHSPLQLKNSEQLLWNIVDQGKMSDNTLRLGVGLQQQYQFSRILTCKISKCTCMTVVSFSYHSIPE